MEALLPTLIASSVPMLLEWGSKIVGYLFSSPEPKNVEERIRLMEADTNRLRALADLDRPVGVPSQWVVDLRAAFRYVGAGAILALLPVVAVWSLADMSRLEVLEMYVNQLAGPVFGFMFGDRVRIAISSMRKGK